MNRFVRPERVTIADVAARAGVSKTTVSHVLSRNRPVATMTRAEVERAIQELGYQPNHAARSLRTQRSAMVALVIPDITNPFYPVLARGLEDSLSAAGYRMFVCNTDAEAQREREYMADAVARRADGIVISSRTFSRPGLAVVRRAGIPLVSVGSMARGTPSADIVLPDDEHGGHEVGTRLLATGHTRIGLISGAPGTGMAREQGFRRALTEAGIAFDTTLARHGGWTRPGGGAAMRQLMALPERPSAVFCCNDLMALGAIDAAADLGLSVPTDIAVAGYDDLEWSALIRPRLTTVANPAYDMGRSAGTLLLDRISDRYRGPRRVVTLACQLVIRESA